MSLKGVQNSPREGRIEPRMRIGAVEADQAAETTAPPMRGRVSAPGISAAC